MKDKKYIVLWAIVVVLMITTILLQVHTIAFTQQMRDTHPLQHKKLDLIIERLNR